MTDITNPDDLPRIKIQARKAAEALKAGIVQLRKGKIAFVFNHVNGNVLIVGVRVTQQQVSAMRTQELADYLLAEIMKLADQSPATPVP